MTPAAAWTYLWPSFVGSVFWGALPPVHLRVVCFARAMLCKRMAVPEMGLNRLDGGVDTSR